jgi:hypothetical protein
MSTFSNIILLYSLDLNLNFSMSSEKKYFWLSDEPHMHLSAFTSWSLAKL